jgi:hypothetical protein
MVAALRSHPAAVPGGPSPTGSSAGDPFAGAASKPTEVAKVAVWKWTHRPLENCLVHLPSLLSALALTT